MNRFYKLFGKKPLIGMVHLLPLPGSPKYHGDMEEILHAAMADMTALQDGGADAFIIENFGDIPYDSESDPVMFAAMTAVASQLAKAAKIPFGINVQFNQVREEWALAHAVSADFIRVEAFVENRVGIHGIASASAPMLQRLRKQFPSETLVFADVNVKHTFPLVDQPLDFSVHEAVESGADALIVTGLLTGQSPTPEDVLKVKEMVPEFPVILGSGVNEENANDFWRISDGAIIGSSLKKNGDVFDRIDLERVHEVSSKIQR